jgi:RNA polymerase primary sigma factor
MAAACPNGDVPPHYFVELDRTPLLSREAERLAAREVRDGEVALWEALLTYRPAFECVAAVIDAAVRDAQLGETPAELEALRRCAQAGATPAAPDEANWHARAAELATTMREVDLRRHCARTAFEAVQRWAETAELQGHGAQAVALYVGRVRQAYRRQAAAKQHFVAANLRLVVMLARRYRHGKLPLGDLIQEGNMGLMTAVERFDPDRGFRFSTYASWWIRHGIRRAIANKASVVRVPVHRLDARRTLARASGRALCLTGRSPTVAQLAAETGLAERKVEELQNQAAISTSSLDRPVGDADGRTFLDCLADESGPSPDEALARHDEHLEIQRLLSGLKPIEARIIKYRYGLDGAETLTLRSLGADLKLSRERVRQIQQDALLRLRRGIQI